MAKRCFDVAFAAVGLLLAAPILLLAAIGIRLSSPGPVLYRARRVGRGGEPFVMHKLRTMHCAPEGSGPAITAAGDSRLFPFGALLRKLKIDELPQLYDVLRGRMSVVGPRPEDPRIVAEHYTPRQRETLRVAPGLTSPGSLYYWLHAESTLTDPDPERAYCERLLPVKLAIDLEYLERATFLSDLVVVAQTAAAILRVAARSARPGRRTAARQGAGIRPAEQEGGLR